MGIDLASRPEKTAVCILRWADAPPALLTLCRGRADDGAALDTWWLSSTAYGMRDGSGARITKVGIDAPFGWPEPFLDALAAYRSAPSWPTGLDRPLGQCRLRETDRAVHRRSGKWPLSVSSDWIAMPAMRCAAMLTEIAEHAGAEAVSRDGAGLCCEVYPDPALRWWTSDAPQALAPRESYKGSAAGERRTELLAALRSRLEIEDSDHRLEQVGLEDDYLDALLCALVARAVELGLSHGPETESERRRAAVEGWIHLPSDSLDLLAFGPDGRSGRAGANANGAPSQRGALAVGAAPLRGAAPQPKDP